jgi:hypothetical protein
MPLNAITSENAKLHELLGFPRRTIPSLLAGHTDVALCSNDPVRFQNFACVIFGGYEKAAAKQLYRFFSEK